MAPHWDDLPSHVMATIVCHVGDRLKDQQSLALLSKSWLSEGEKPFWSSITFGKHPRSLDQAHRLERDRERFQALLRLPHRLKALQKIDMRITHPAQVPLFHSILLASATSVRSLRMRDNEDENHSTGGLPTALMSLLELRALPKELDLREFSLSMATGDILWTLARLKVTLSLMPKLKTLNISLYRHASVGMWAPSPTPKLWPDLEELENLEIVLGNWTLSEVGDLVDRAPRLNNLHLVFSGAIGPGDLTNSDLKLIRRIDNVETVRMRCRWYWDEEETQGKLFCAGQLYDRVRNMTLDSEDNVISPNRNLLLALQHCSFPNLETLTFNFTQSLGDIPWDEWRTILDRMPALRLITGSGPGTFGDPAYVEEEKVVIRSYIGKGHTLHRILFLLERGLWKNGKKESKEVVLMDGEQVYDSVCQEGMATRSQIWSLNRGAEGGIAGGRDLVLPDEEWERIEHVITKNKEG